LGAVDVELEFTSFVDVGDVCPLLGNEAGGGGVDTFVYTRCGGDASMEFLPVGFEAMPKGA